MFHFQSQMRHTLICLKSWNVKKWMAKKPSRMKNGDKNSMTLNEAVNIIRKIIKEFGRKKENHVGIVTIVEKWIALVQFHLGKNQPEDIEIGIL